MKVKETPKKNRYFIVCYIAQKSAGDSLTGQITQQSANGLFINRIRSIELIKEALSEVKNNVNIVVITNIIEINAADFEVWSREY